MIKADHRVATYLRGSTLAEQPSRGLQGPPSLHRCRQGARIEDAGHGTHRDRQGPQDRPGVGLPGNGRAWPGTGIGREGLICRLMTGAALILRRANVSRDGGDCHADDFDVSDGDREVGRIYRANSPDEIWFWGVSFLLTNRTSYGHADTLDEAKTAFGKEL
jgi:hypothetical protein